MKLSPFHLNISTCLLLGDVDLLDLDSRGQSSPQLLGLLLRSHVQSVQEPGAPDLELGAAVLVLLDGDLAGVGATGLEEEVFDLGDLSGHFVGNLGAVQGKNLKARMGKRFVDKSFGGAVALTPRSARSSSGTGGTARKKRSPPCVCFSDL